MAQKTERYYILRHLKDVALCGRVDMNTPFIVHYPCKFVAIKHKGFIDTVFHCKKCGESIDEAALKTLKTMRNFITGATEQT